MNLNYKTLIKNSLNQDYDECVKDTLGRIDKERAEENVKTINLGNCYKLRTIYYVSNYYKRLASQALLKLNDIKEFKQNLYVASKLEIMEYAVHECYGLPGYYLSWTLFLSDSPALMQYVMEHAQEFIDIYKDCIMGDKNFLLRCILLALTDNWQDLDKYANSLLESKYKNKIPYRPDCQFFVALCKQDIQGMEKALNILLDLKVAKKRQYDLDGVFDFYLNFIVLTYAKLATLKGFDLNIDHPTAPKELIVYAPLDEYLDPPYEFMQDYSFENHLEWGKKRLEIERNYQIEANKLKNRIKRRIKRFLGKNDD